MNLFNFHYRGATVYVARSDKYTQKPREKEITCSIFINGTEQARGEIKCTLIIVIYGYLSVYLQMNSNM